MTSAAVRLVLAEPRLRPVLPLVRLVLPELVDALDQVEADLGALVDDVARELGAEPEAPTERKARRVEAKRARAELLGEEPPPAPRLRKWKGRIEVVPDPPDAPPRLLPR